MKSLTSIVATSCVAISLSTMPVFANGRNVTMDIPDFSASRYHGQWKDSTGNRTGAIRGIDWNGDGTLDTFGYFTQCHLDKPFAVQYSFLGGAPAYHFDEVGKFKFLTYDFLLNGYENKVIGDLAPSCPGEKPPAKTGPWVDA